MTGKMDLNYSGPDNTCEGRPFRFWLNNDCDEPGVAVDPGQDVEVLAINARQKPDGELRESSLSAEPRGLRPALGPAECRRSLRTMGMP